MKTKLGHNYYERPKCEAAFIPSILEANRSSDIFSYMMKDRIIFLNTEINEYVSGNIISQILYLQSQDSKKDINLYIMSPGGDIYCTLAIYDIMQRISTPIATYCIGMAASAGAVLLCSGTKGKRFALPNSRVMIHQPWGGLGGDSSLMQIQSKEIENLKTIMLSIMSKHTGKVLKQIEKDCDRDHWMNAEDSKKYGMVDIILGGKKNYGL